MSLGVILMLVLAAHSLRTRGAVTSSRGTSLPGGETRLLVILVAIGKVGGSKHAPLLWLTRCCWLHRTPCVPTSRRLQVTFPRSQSPRHL